MRAKSLVPVLILQFVIVHFTLCKEQANKQNDTSKPTPSNSSLRTWEPPAEIQKNYPFVLSGFDYDNLPIWLVEFGHFDLRAIVAEGKEEVFERYIQKFIEELLPMSLEMASTAENKVEQAVVLIDYQDLNLRQLADLRTVEFGLEMVRKYKLVAEKFLHHGYIVNANFLAERVITTAKPFLGRVFERLEVYGSNRAKWVPQLLRTIPPDQIPEWYGGSKSHKPVLVYG